MQYLLLIYENEALMAARSPEDGKKLFQDYMAYTASIRESGNFVAGDALERVSTATTVRLREGKTMTTDGPFAETKEQLGGYYLVEAKNLDEAIALAARSPSSSPPAR
jgi:hypothetical protein